MKKFIMKLRFGALLTEVETLQKFAKIDRSKGITEAQKLTAQKAAKKLREDFGGTMPKVLTKLLKETRVAA